MFLFNSSPLSCNNLAKLSVKPLAILFKSFPYVPFGLFTVWLYLVIICGVHIPYLSNCIPNTDVPYSSSLCGFLKSSLLILSTSFFTAKKTTLDFNLPRLYIVHINSFGA